MRREVARKLLGLTDSTALTVQQVQAAFAAAVKRAHPDTGSSLSAVSVNTVQQARDAILNLLADENNACKLCRGTGNMRVVMGIRPCGACKGTGVRQ